MTTLHDIMTPPRRETWDVSLDAFKVFAFVLMVIDHVAAISQADELWRVPGRFVLPMFALALAHKFTRYSTGATRQRLLVWACVAQLLLLPFGREQLNILFTLGFGLYVGSQKHLRMYAAWGLLAVFGAFEMSSGRHVMEYGTPGVAFVAAACMAQRKALWWLVCIPTLYLANMGGIMGLAAILGALWAYAYLHREMVFAWVRYVPTNVWYLLYPLHLVLIYVVSAFLR